MGIEASVFRGKSEEQTHAYLVTVRTSTSDAGTSTARTVRTYNKQGTNLAPSYDGGEENEFHPLNGCR
jgi:hypothetical protein